MDLLSWLRQTFQLALLTFRLALLTSRLALLTFRLALQTFRLALLTFRLALFIILEQLLGAKLENLIDFLFRERVTGGGGGDVTLGDDELGQHQLLLALLRHALLHRRATHEAVDHHFVLLSDAVSATERLCLIMYTYK